MGQHHPGAKKIIGERRVVLDGEGSLHRHLVHPRATLLQIGRVQRVGGRRAATIQIRRKAVHKCWHPLVDRYVVDSPAGHARERRTHAPLEE
jgi:hypothetical protein